MSGSWAMTKKFAYILALFLLAAAPASQAHADIYKYVDEDGVIHFSNVPVDSGAKKVIKEDTAPEKKAPAPSPDKVAEPARHKAVPAPQAAPQAGPVAAPVDMPSGSVPYADIIKEKCDKYGVDSAVVKAIIKAESNFNPAAVSNKGARGLMQLMPNTAADMAVMNSFDPEQNIEGGVHYLRSLLDMFGGDVELSVAAYNCGQGRVIRSGNCVPEIAETKNYVKKVLKYTNNPVTGVTLSRPIYKIEMKDGSVIFTDTPVAGTNCSRVD